MKRHSLLLLVTAGLLALFTLLNCADPIERDNSNPIGTTPIVDTLYIIDTVSGIDTVIVIDTVLDIDTLVVIDTVTDNDTIITIDTILVIDTVRDVDTVVDIDTITIIDTVIDSIISIDTVIVVLPDTGIFRPFCAQIASNRQEIVWMFQNPAGYYRLTFMAALEKPQPNQTLTVTIDGQSYEWDPVANSEFIVEQYLNMHATILIVPNKPPAAGHAIDVCLTVTPL